MITVQFVLMGLSCLKIPFNIININICLLIVNIIVNIIIIINFVCLLLVVSMRGRERFHNSGGMCVVEFESNFLLFFDYFSRTIDYTNRKYFCSVSVTFKGSLPILNYSQFHSFL